MAIQIKFYDAPKSSQGVVMLRTHNEYEVNVRPEVQTPFHFSPMREGPLFDKYRISVAELFFSKTISGGNKDFQHPVRPLDQLVIEY